jgi:hypothetical protein
MAPLQGVRLAAPGAPAAALVPPVPVRAARNAMVAR